MGFYKRMNHALLNLDDDRLDYLTFGHAAEIKDTKMLDDIATIWLEYLNRTDRLYATAFAFGLLGEEDLYVRGEPVDYKKIHEMVIEEGADYAVEAYLAGAPLETIINRTTYTIDFSADTGAA